MALGLAILLDVKGVVTRYKRFQDRFSIAFPVWMFRAVGLFGIVGGILILIFGNSP
jgi:hypothetical protein